jgi:hypothetical protein
MVVEIGLRVGPKGLNFFGLEEVNNAINQGRSVVSIQPGDAIMEKRGEDSGNVRLALTGFKVKVQISDK